MAVVVVRQMPLELAGVVVAHMLFFEITRPPPHRFRIALVPVARQMVPEQTRRLAEIVPPAHRANSCALRVAESVRRALAAR